MKKRAISLLSVLALCAALCASAFAANHPCRLNDMAGLLSDSEAQMLLARLDETSERLQFDLVIVTTDTLGGKSAEAYIDDFFDYGGFGFGADYDGAALLISMEPGNHYCHISTSGSGIDCLTDSRIDSILDEAADGYFARGAFYDGMDAFVSRCERYLTGSTGASKASLRDRLPDYLLSAVVVGMIAAVTRVGAMRAAMKTVRPQAAADSYLSGGVKVTSASDLFLYRTVSKQRRQQSASSGGSTIHHASSGRSHGGGGRHF